MNGDGAGSRERALSPRIPHRVIDRDRAIFVEAVAGLSGTSLRAQSQCDLAATSYPHKTGEPDESCNRALRSGIC
jgi:hypothetical protein